MKLRNGLIYLMLILFIQENITVFAQLQSKELVSKFFPDPALEINTPGFSKTDGFMNYEEMVSYLQIIADKRSDIVKLRYIGESISGKKIPAVYIGTESGNSKLKIWMQGGLHGNEPAGTESLLMFIDDLIRTKTIDSILNFVSFAFVPMANIDGYVKQVRNNDNNADLNRDQVMLEQKESICLKKAFTSFSPAIAIDFHEFRPFRKELDDFGNGNLCIAQDVLFLPSGNLNIPSQLRDLTNSLYLKNIEEKLLENKISFNNYFVPDTIKNGVNILRMGGGSPRSSSTSFGLTNSVSILFEIRGIKLGRDSYKRRVYSGYLIANSILETTLKNREKVRKTVASSIKETIKRKNPIVIHSNPSVYMSDMTFIDVDNLEYKTLNLEIVNGGRSQAISKRQRPKAYLILADNEQIVQKLQILGLKIDTLKSELEAKTEVYKIEANKNDLGSEADINISISVQNKVFPKGSFAISTAQKNANVAVSTLEPEMENSFFKYKMIKVNSDGEIPIYRILTDVKSVNRTK